MQDSNFYVLIIVIVYIFILRETVVFQIGCNLQPILSALLKHYKYAFHLSPIKLKISSCQNSTNLTIKSYKILNQSLSDT